MYVMWSIPAGLHNNNRVRVTLGPGRPRLGIEADTYPWPPHSWSGVGLLPSCKVWTTTTAVDKVFAPRSNSGNVHPGAHAVTAHSSTCFAHNTRTGPPHSVGPSLSSDRIPTPWPPAALTRVVLQNLWLTLLYISIGNVRRQTALPLLPLPRALHSHHQRLTAKRAPTPSAARATQATRRPPMSIS